MRCPYCHCDLPPGGKRCPRCGRLLAPERGAHVYRDRRHRLLWGRSRAAWLRLGAAIVIVVLALAAVAILAVRLSAQRGEPSAPPATPPAATPTTSAAPVPTTAPTPAHTPTPAPVVTTVPTATPVPDEPPVRSISSREELIDLYWWMIGSGEAEIELEAMDLPAADVMDVTDKFSNYFEAFQSTQTPPGVRVELKSGLQALLAIEKGEVDALDADVRQVAEQAQAAVAVLIRPGMSDWEKELAIHDYIVEHCDYLNESPEVQTADARGFFLHGKCQCAGYVDTFRLLGRLAGLEIENLGGQTTRDEAGSKGHAWNLIRLDGQWYFVDLTWDDMIEAESTLEHTFFNLPYGAFWESRTWDWAYTPWGDYAEALDTNYYYDRPEYAVATPEDALDSAVRQLDESGKAYLLLTGEVDIRAVARALAGHYQTTGTCTELSEDLDLNLYRFTMK